MLYTLTKIKKEKIGGESNEIITVYPIEWRKSLHRYGKEILLLPNMKERMVRTTKNVSKAFSETFNNGIKDSKRLVRGGFNS